MTIRTDFPLLDDTLGAFAGALGSDRLAYTHHVKRVLNYYEHLDAGPECPRQVLIAAIFHDLGIWTAGTFDYLPPSLKLADDYCAQGVDGHLAREVAAIITYHHKQTPYRGQFAHTVETFRRADLVDVSRHRSPGLSRARPRRQGALSRRGIPQALVARLRGGSFVTRSIRFPWCAGRVL
jgi:hypothetical protein